ncbi:MAG: endonuclease/exonuclease/phosphatase family protein [Actinomycetota bacterium]|nr:endonuclease/exonuclease/phosphatase family protein [Actinomycetota bacterium]
MSQVVVEMPQRASDEYEKLKARLDQELPAKSLDQNLLIGTWNIRAFGGLTEKWISSEVDSPKRDLFSLACIGEIISRFDVVALQEVKGDIKALRQMMDFLGPRWGFIMTDVTLGSPGNDERMAFLFDTRRVTPSGLAGELVVPEEWISGDDTNAVLRTQFARTPYAVSFTSGDQTFILVTLHVIFGDTPEDRTAELQGIARWVADWAKREESWGHNLLVLGDFNIDRKGDPNYEAFTSQGLRPPLELEGLPRTIFEAGKDKYYDQIAWFTGEGQVPILSLDYTGRAGSFDFTQVVLTSMTRNDVSWRISDHYPLWAEFSV